MGSRAGAEKYLHSTHPATAAYPATGCAAAAAAPYRAATAVYVAAAA